MTPEKILELAAEHETDTFSEHVWWAFDRKALIAFAQAIIEAERESNDNPVAWAVFDGEENWGLIQYLGNENFQEDFLKRNPDPMYRDWVKPLYEYPPPARKLTDEEILALAVRNPPVNPFWINSETVTCGEVRSTAIGFARAIERRINGEEE